MLASRKSKLQFGGTFGPLLRYFLRPFIIVGSYRLENLRYDLVAGITVAVILLPQAIAFALVAELPPQMGLYAAIVGAIIGGLWGSSNQSHTGPTNAISLLVFSSLAAVAAPGSPDFIVAAGMLAVMAGLFQLLMGVARLGMLVNFVSHSVVVGFTAGAAVLITIRQLAPLLGLSISSRKLVSTIMELADKLTTAHLVTAGLGIGAIVTMVALRRFWPRLPAALIAMALSSLIVFIFKLHEMDVSVIGDLPKGLPPLADLPLLDFEIIAKLSAGALAVGAIGLVETSAITRSIAVDTRQRLDSNQEFVGQGLANILVGLFSGYPGAGSFSRSAVNHSAGARTALAALFSSIFVLAAMLLLAPLAAYLPRASLAAVLIVVAYGMFNVEEIKRIALGTRGDAAIMVVTFLSTLLLQIEFAVLTGILLSLAYYLMKTSTPRIHFVTPDVNFKHFGVHEGKPHCPQLGIVEILGDLYFGAIAHVEDAVHDHSQLYPSQRFLLIRMGRVNHVDFSGIHALETMLIGYRERGGDLYFVDVNQDVHRAMRLSGFLEHLGEANILSEDSSISDLFHRVLDPAVCIYECSVRVFKECQNLPKHYYPQLLHHHATGLASHEFNELSPESLRDLIKSDKQIQLFDIREPREYQQNHIPEAALLPLPRLAAGRETIDRARPIVLVCRTGRRSRLAAMMLEKAGFDDVSLLAGGLQSWESAGYLVAIGHGAADTYAVRQESHESK